MLIKLTGQNTGLWSGNSEVKRSLENRYRGSHQIPHLTAAYADIHAGFPSIVSQKNLLKLFLTSAFVRVMDLLHVQVEKKWIFATVRWVSRKMQVDHQLRSTYMGIGQQSSRSWLFLQRKIVSLTPLLVVTSMYRNVVLLSFRKS